jgi:hypothetical protein
VARGEFVVESANHTVEIWHTSGGTATLNVGASSAGMSAMTGGTMKMPAGWKSNTRVKGIARGDLVFVFGERENHTLKAQLVLFAAPTAVRVTPKATATPTPTVSATVSPAATTAVVPAMATPTSVSSTLTGQHS